MKASIEVNPWNNKVAPHAWVPLETIFSSFLQMIFQRRVIAVPDSLNNFELSPEWESKPTWDVSPDWQEHRLRNNPWVLSLEDNPVVDSTVAAWNKLLASIESRIPRFRNRKAEPITYAKEDVEKCSLKSPFIPKFLCKARVPVFRYVAPGLRLALPAELSEQPFMNINVEAQLRPGENVQSKWQLHPFLFLRADRRMSNEEGITAAHNDTQTRYPGKYWEYPLDSVPEYEAGLYLQAKTPERADGFKLLLPFLIASNHYALNSDMSEIQGGSFTYNGLYRQGYHKILPDSDSHRLESLLGNWTKMVELGYWEVDENGVTGGIGKFIEADSPEKYDRYIVEKTW